MSTNQGSNNSTIVEYSPFLLFLFFCEESGEYFWSAEFSAEESSNRNSSVFASATENKSPSHTNTLDVSFLQTSESRWDGGSFQEKLGRRRSCPERSCNLQSEPPAWLAGCQPARPRHLATLYLTTRVYYVDSRHADFYYLWFFRGFIWGSFFFREVYLGFLARPTFFLFKSVSHFGIMHANASTIDDLAQLVDNWKCEECLIVLEIQQTKDNGCPWSKPQAQFK